MKLISGLVGVAALVGCTSPNPRSCIDGICNDQRYPYCDVDGSLEGTPQTCIAVECTPGEFKRCTSSTEGGSADEKLTCNATGNNYDTTACPNGCDPSIMGCTVPPPPPMGCQMSTECTNVDAPFCDPSDHTCRRCAIDAECGSGVCDRPTGHCVAEADVTYVAPNGVSGTCGSKTTPCTIVAGWSHMDATHHVIKLQAGSYAADGLVAPSTSVVLYGTGSTVAGMTGNAIATNGPADLRIDDVTFDSGGGGSSFGVGATSAATTTVHLNHVVVRSSALMNWSKATVLADNTAFEFQNVDGQLWVADGMDFTLTHGTVTGAGLRIVNARIHVSNTLFRDTQRSAIAVAGPNPTGGQSDISFCTFVNSPLDQSSVPAVVDVRNSIVSGMGFSTEAVRGTAFTLHYSLATPQNDSLGSDHIIVNVDPMFVGAASGDFHLASGSPAVDAADPTASAADDHDGAMRPKGGGRDLGAFESH